MELETVLNLVKAGFTKDEILQMAQPKPNPADPVPASAPTPETVPDAKPEQSPVVAPVAVAVPEPQPAPQPAQVDVPSQSNTTLEDIMKGIAQLTSAVQANAIASSVIPQGISQPPKPEDIVAEIIRPSYKERR